MVEQVRQRPSRQAGRTAARRPRPALLVLLACLLVLAGVPLGAAVQASTRARDLGARPAVLTSVTQPATAAPAAAGPTQAPTARPAAPAVRRAPAGVRRPSPPPPPPARVTIERLEVSAPVVPVGVAPAGDLALPEQADTVGWYRFAAAPGDTSGSVVLAGHVDSRSQGPGALFALRGARPGDVVVVRRGDGRELRYAVAARERMPRDRLPVTELFSRAGAPRLTLITCGGRFLPERGGYQDNVVVTAVPLPQ